MGFLGSVWNPENTKEKLKENKSRLKLNKLILYVLFKLILFVSLYNIQTKKFKNM